MPQKKPCFAATMMGAVPYRELERAASVILECLPEAPSLPVMTRSIRWMVEGIPCLVFDREKKVVRFDLSTEREGEILEFYERIEADDLDYFATTPKTAPFFHDMIEYLKRVRPPRLQWVVFHTSGPLLLGDLLKQKDGTPAVYNETLRDILIQGLNAKARWLEQKIRSEIPGVEVVADLPETTLINFTSSAGTGSREAVIEAVNRSFAGLTGLSWVHCCANIDWSLLLQADIDVVNFDAYQHSEAFSLYAKEVRAFLERGGMLGWGIVPVVSEWLQREQAEGLIRRLEEGIRRLVRQGIDEMMIAQSSWVLPSCETVLLTPEESDRALRLTREISEAMKAKYGFPS